MHAYMYVCMHAWVFGHLAACTCVHTCVCACMRVCTFCNTPPPPPPKVLMLASLGMPPPHNIDYTPMIYIGHVQNGAIFCCNAWTTQRIWGAERGRN